MKAKRMVKLATVAASAFWIGLGLVQAQAATIVQTASFGPQSTDWGTGEGLYPVVNLHFAGFDTSLGTLTGVSIQAGESETGTVKNQNDGSSPTTVKSRIDNTWDVFLPSRLGGLTFLQSDSVTGYQADALNPGAVGPVYSVSATS
ncbi:MAG TPA: choice-of-anchor E domain-containing protein, partial [Rhodopila sp.]|nr:choice-of-anchor E domain-containing protein [Rhodopila sp.]